MPTSIDYTRGYTQAGTTLSCLYCEQQYATTEVYPSGDHYYQAPAAMTQHLSATHGGALQALLHADADCGLSASLTTLAELLAQDLSDAVIAQRLGVASATVRSQKFKLRAKVAAAARLVALGELLALNDDTLLPSPAATQVDARYAITPAERTKTLATFVDATGRIATWPSKEKRKLILLSYLMADFDAHKNYSESAVNAILQQHVSDYVTVRRNLIEYGFLARTPDGRTYWVKTA